MWRSGQLCLIGLYSCRMVSWHIVVVRTASVARGDVTIASVAIAIVSAREQRKCRVQHGWGQGLAGVLQNSRYLRGIVPESVQVRYYDALPLVDCNVLVHPL